MTKVIFDISVSLDGFVTASNVRPEEPMGDGGQRLREWAFGEDERNHELLAEGRELRRSGHRGPAHLRPFGSVVGDGPTGPARVPVFVVTYAEPGKVPKGSVYTFV